MAGKYEARNTQGDHRVLDDDPKAIALLKEEHRIFRKLFDRAEKAEGADLKAVADELCLRLTVHMTIEEEILYPALKPVIGADEVDEGIVEHASGKRIIAELEQLKGTEELFKSKVHVLGEETIHHIDEEDEDLFADAKEAHAKGRIDLDAVGDDMRARQAQLYRQVEETGEVGVTCETDADEIAHV
ncbi:hemerythrin domain-containing protein [Sphingomonas naphthae]|uniref:Hemerythrin domain-containing protein n=1 Tax=Sphingomonas naphthae TaxID=1813468 RepID=A0ABY7TFV5_9SPHN|nr:hemerythrin domain-containing protein [Sphingomonas naphthae]WCT72112.1 hemerythrin domain-containing protein [Sphingomonas naphthae]